jgi:hypothetical protein
LHRHLLFVCLLPPLPCQLAVSAKSWYLSISEFLKSSEKIILSRHLTCTLI